VTTLADYRAWIGRVPMPTEDQCVRFSSHLRRVHSWYKVDLMRGRRFVVFLDPHVGGEAGGDPQVIDRETSRSPWRGTYREQFGHLAYLFKAGGGNNWAADYHLPGGREYPAPGLPAEIAEACGFVLYPYVNVEKFFAVAPSLHIGALRAIWAGRPHPGARALSLLRESDLFIDAFLKGDEGCDHAQCEPVWNAIHAREKQQWGVSSRDIWPSHFPWPERLAHLRWATQTAELTLAQRGCARQMWMRHRKAAVLALKERYKVDRAIANLVRLSGDTG
jgi:hypothetical protein